MKCTLKKVEQGVVATIDKRPEFGKYCYNIMYNEIDFFDEIRGFYSTDHAIIASTFGVGKELEYDFNHKEYVFGLPQDDIVFGEQYDYTETETQVIIQL